MSSLLQRSEDLLEPVYKGLPPLSKGAKDWFVKVWPILALILGIIQLLLAWSLWHTGHLVSNAVNYLNQVSRLYGNGTTVQNLGFFYWLALVVLIINGVILLIAYPGLKARKKTGWDMLFLAGIVNVIYGLSLAFDSNYGGIGQFIGAIIGSAIAFYLLFQVRSYYKGAGASQSTHAEPTATPKA